MKPGSTEKRWSFIVNITYFAIILALIYAFFKYALIWLLPFVIGFVFASVADPIVSWITDKTKINRRFCAFIITLIEYAVLVALFWLVISKIISSAQSVFTDLPGYFNHEILPMWESVSETLLTTSKRIPPEVMQYIYSLGGGILESLSGTISEVSEKFLTFVADTTSELPFIILSVIFTILSSFFFAMDYDKIKELTRKLLPQKTVNIISDTKFELWRTLLKYAKAYILILLVTFSELSLGLYILDVKNFWGIAAIIAVFDILPVLGTGGILIPWSIYSFITANYFMGAGLIILYLVTLVVRNLIEPRIIGTHLGLHPLVTIISLYVGYQLMGVLGMFGLPVSITILIALHKTNKLSIWPLTKIFSDSEEEPEPCSTASEEASQQEKQTANK